MMDPQVMPADQVWYLATEGGARTLGLERVGRLAPGWQADLQLIDADLPTPLTTHNLYEQLLLYRNRQDVRGTMVAGEMLVRDGVVCDVELEELRGRVNRAAHNLWVKGQ
jgi:cytosine/adenosine deaminase-related metal-dependent hydrolase